MSSLAAGPIPQGGRAAAFAPAGVALALLVVVVQVRIDDPWADGVLFVVAALGAIPLLAGLALATIGAVLWGLRRSAAQIAARS